MELASLLPSKTKHLMVVQETAYIVVNHSVYLTFDENVAIAILDSAIDDVMVVVARSGAGDHIVYTNCHGVGLFDTPTLQVLIEEWFDNETSFGGSQTLH